MKVTKRNLAKTVTLALVMASAVSVACAAELPSTGVVAPGDYTVSDTMTVTANATPAIGVPGTGTTDRTTINVAEGKTLTVIAQGPTNGSCHGVIANTDIFATGADVILKATGALPASGLGQHSIDSITAKSITISSEHGYGIYAHVNGGSTDVERHTLKADTVSITSGQHAIYSAGNGAEVKIEDFDRLTLTVADGKEGSGVHAGAQGNVTLTGKEVIVSSQQRAGLAIINGGNVKVTVDKLDVTASNLTGDSSGEARKNSVISANSTAPDSDDGLLDITVNEMFKVSGDDSITNAIGATNGNEIKITSNGITQVDGDLNAEDGGSLKIGFKGNDSYLNGQVKTDTDSTTNLTLADDATWINHGSSTVTNLTSNGGNIDIGESGEAIINNLNGTDLTIQTDAIGDDSGWVSLRNEYNTNITVQGSEELMAQIENGSLTQEGALSGLTDIVDNRIDQIVITQGEVLGEITAEVGEDNELINVQVRENTTNASMIDMTALSLVSWRGEFDDLNSRLGDLRSSREDNGLWTRFTRGESSYGSVTNRSSMYQIGYDRQAGDWTVGLAYSYTDGTSSFADGRGENTHNVVSLYGTKMSASGSYLDLVAKYGNLDYEYDVVGGAGSADYDTDAYAFSAEVGKRITASTGAWFEPQFQLTYGTVDSVSYKTANDIKVHQDSVDSFVARAGFMAGKPFSKGDIYVKASYLYDFEGEVKGTFANDNVSTDINRDLGGGWWEVGMGLCAHLSDVTHFYLDFEKAFAGEVDTDWKYNAGLRYSF